MSFDLEAELFNARLQLRLSIRRNAMIAKTAINLEAEKVRDHINCLFDFAEVESEIRRFRWQYKALYEVWRYK